MPKPVPQEQEILIRVHATTVAVADSRLRALRVPRGLKLPVRLAMGWNGPKHTVLGVELAGTVASVGSAVTRFQPGDAVFAEALDHFGAHAEYICLPEDGLITQKPAGLSFVEAAALPIGARTALHYLRQANLQEGQSILVYGASGSVGTYAVQLGRHFGLDVSGVCSTRNQELVSSLGAKYVFDYTKPGWMDDLGTYDAVLLAVDKWPFRFCRKALKPKGVYLNVTHPIPSPAMLWMSWTTGKRMVMGQNSPKSVKDLQYLGDLAAQGVIEPVIDRTYPLHDIIEAHSYVDQGHKVGNVAIAVDPALKSTNTAGA